MNHHNDIDGQETAYFSEPNYSNVAPEFAFPEQDGITPLGYDKGVYFYYSHAARQVVAMSADKHTKNAMLSLASLAHYWENTRFASRKGINWEGAVADLIDKCRQAGIYNPDKIRGRGAWIDGDKAVLHLGDRLICAGQEIPLTIPGSPFIYEAAQSLSIATASSLSASEAIWLVKVCNLLRWERPVYGKFLAGWIALAPICGALKWRPSIWVTGGPGSGKSYIRENIMARVLGNIALPVQSKTTEAGIRQSLGSDARPVLFDEAEREDQASAARMQSVLDLVRQSSSEGGAEIVKGTGTQTGAKRYRIRSMFAFQSINVGLQYGADESRVSVLTLREPAKNDPNAQQAFADLEATVFERLTPEFSAGLIARSVALIPIIRANAEIFATVIASGNGTRRLGDQVGTLLAGAYSLHSSNIVTPEQAAEFIGREEWKRELVEDGEKDEEQLLARLMEGVIQVDSSRHQVGKLLEGARSEVEDKSLPPLPFSRRTLRDNGIAIGEDINHKYHGGVMISNNHGSIKKILAGTQWDAKWNKALLRLPGAISVGPERFTSTRVSRSVWLPFSVVFPGDNQK